MTQFSRQTNLKDLLVRFVSRQWRSIALSVMCSVSVTLLGLLSIGLFAALPNLVISALDSSLLGTRAAPAQGGSLADSLIAYITSLSAFLSDRFGILGGVFFLSAAYLLVNILSRSLQLLGDWIFLHARSRSALSMQKFTLEKALELSIDYFHHHSSGEIKSRVNDSRSVIDLAFELVRVIVIAFPVALFYWSLLLLTHWPLTAAVLCLFVFKSVLSRLLAERIRAHVVSSSRLKHMAFARLVQTFSNVISVKLFSRESFECREIMKGLSAQNHHDLKNRDIESLNSALQNILNSITSVAVITLGTLFVLNGSLSVMALIVYFFTASRAQEPSRQLSGVQILIQRLRGHFQVLDELLGVSPSVVDGPSVAPSRASLLSFSNVTFSYGTNRQALRGISFDIKAGEKIALVGPSGAGKSTVLTLLLRLLDPAEGSITLNGTDIRQFTQKSYRDLFGVVSQDPALFAASLRDNIAYAAGDGGFTDEQLSHVIAVSHVDEFLAGLPQGLDTQIGDRGVRLSGGQKQRLALARAILRDPQILVLDEATSSLDSQSELLIQDALDGFLGSRTAIIVAHRLSTIRMATRILVLKDGQIVESGTHRELLLQDGEYKRLHDIQFRQ